MHPRLIKKNIFYEKMRLRPDCFIKEYVMKARLIKQNAPQARFLIET